jgi:hypothetical protein
MVEHLSANTEKISRYDLESADQVPRVFEWSDESDDEQEDSRLLKEFRTRNSIGNIKIVKKYNITQQPDFHERNKSFTESYCRCCLGPQQRYDLSREEVSSTLMMISKTYRYRLFADKMV